jgi:hypothetical protein
VNLFTSYKTARARARKSVATLRPALRFGAAHLDLTLNSNTLAALALSERSFPRGISRTLAISSWLLVMACTDLTGPALPATAERFTPPSFYSIWWDMTRACSGADGELSAVTWYVVPDDTPLRLNGVAVDGYWQATDNRIVMKSSGIFDGEFIRHEMLHSLTRGGGHSRKMFLDRCGGTVNCERDCLSEAGPAPAIASSVPRVPADSFELSATVSPKSPSASSNEGYFSVTVAVRNPTTHQVVAAVLPSGDAGPPGSFSYDFTFPNRSEWWRDERATDNSIIVFAPGETKIHIFDFFASGPRANGQNFIGTDSVRVAYVERWLPRIPLIIRP